MSEPCERLEAWLVDRAPSGDPSPRWADEHAATCAACAALLGADTRLRVDLAAQLPAPRDAVWERIRAQTAPGALARPLTGGSAWFGSWLRWPAVALAGVLLVLFFRGRTPDGTPRIGTCAGGVSVVSGGKQSPAVAGRALAPGAWVVCDAGGSCSLELPGARVDVGPLAQVVLEQPRELRMLSGSAGFRVEPVREAAGGVSFRVHLPGGDVEVRGTTFRIEVEAAQARVWLQVGHLRVRAGSGAVRDLEAGESAELPAASKSNPEPAGAPASAAPAGAPDEKLSERARVETRAPASATGRPPPAGRPSTGGF